MTEAADFPAVHRKKPAPVGTKPDSRAQFMSKAIAGITKQFLPEGEHREDRVEDVLSSTDARWWRLANLNSALVSNAEGSGAWRYQRDAKHYRRALAESIALHAELIRRWASLSREYRSSSRTCLSSGMGKDLRIEVTRSAGCSPEQYRGG